MYRDSGGTGVKGVLIETDLIVEFLTAGESEIPLLRRLLMSTTCFSTFIQAAEIYSTVQEEIDQRTVERALFGLKILGASSRYAKTIGEVLSSQAPMRGHRSAIVGAIALESQLPVVTDLHYQALSTIARLHVVKGESLRNIPEGENLLSFLL